VYYYYNLWNFGGGSKLNKNNNEVERSCYNCKFYVAERYNEKHLCEERYQKSLGMAKRIPRLKFCEKWMEKT
jgi:hypothetical protein